MKTKNYSKIMKNIIKIIGFLIFTLGFVIILISIIFFVQERMDSCSKDNATAHCITTQRNPLVLDIIQPLKEK